MSFRRARPLFSGDIEPNPAGRRQIVARKLALITSITSSLVLLIVAVLGLVPVIKPASAALTNTTFVAEADARVEGEHPDANFGMDHGLVVDNEPLVESYLRFVVQGVPGAAHTAKLRLYVYNGSFNGPAIFATGNTWSETDITWRNRPAPSSAVVDDKDALPANGWVEYDVTPVITGNATYSFVLIPTSSDGTDFYAREGGGFQPELVLTFADSVPTETLVPPTETPVPTETLIPPTETPVPTAIVVPPTATLTPTSTSQPPLPSPDPLTCAGYPEHRQFIETQSWWTPEPGQTGTNEGHVHLGACLPERETLTADTTIAVRIVMHNNPGHGNYVSMVVKGTDYETTVQKISLKNMSCPIGTCEQWLTFTLPIAAFKHSGLQEIRFRAFIPEPPQNRQAREMRANLNAQLIVENGRSRADVKRAAHLRGKGWYTHAKYCEATYLSGTIPDSPLIGLWQPSVKFETHSSDSSLPVTGYTVRIDPDFHNGIEGQILRQGAEPLPPTQLTIDTTQLANGPHKLFLRADCRDYKLGSTNRGVLVIPFEVRN